MARRSDRAAALEIRRWLNISPGRLEAELAQKFLVLAAGLCDNPERDETDSTR